MGRATPRPCLALLRVGFAMRRPSPDARCALTAPFHPCLCPTAKRGHRRSTLCCTFRRLTAPGCYPAPCPAELGLSSDGAVWPKPSLRGDPHSRARSKIPHGRRPGPRIVRGHIQHPAAKNLRAALTAPELLSCSITHTPPRPLPCPGAVVLGSSLTASRRIG